MAWAPIDLITIQYQNPADSTPYSGAVLKAYAAGTSTNIVMATDDTGGTTFTDVSLNSSGNPEHLGQTIIPHIDQAYKISFYATQAAADADTPAIWSIDNLTPLTITGSFTTDDAISSASTDVINMTHTTTGTAVAGIGTGLGFTTETATGNNELGMSLQSVSTDVSSGSEDFDFVVKTMSGGSAATEVFRVTSAGVVTASGTTFGNALTANPLSQFAATTSLQLLGVISDETGSGSLVFGTAPTITLANGTGLPLTGISDFGTGVATALAVNVGSAGAALVFDGAGGTPTSIVLTNASGTAASLTAGTVTTNANLTGHITSTGNAAILGAFTLAQLNTAISDATAAILGANTFTGTQNFADNTLQRANLLDYGEVTNALGDLGGGTDDIDLVAGNSVSATVSTSTQTFTFSNPTASDELCGFTLTLTNGGSQTVNWPASVDWAAATAPTLTAAGVDVLVFFTIDGGTIWNGFLSGANLS